MTTAELPAFLSVAETARTLGLSETTVRRRIADGSLPALRFTSTSAIRVPRAALLPGSRTLAERGVPAEPGQSTSPQLAGLDGEAA